MLVVTNKSMSRSVLLINTNISRPPVSPVGLEYVGEALRTSEVPVHVLDLAFETEWQACLARELRSNDPLIIGLSVRNTDDCCFATRKSFLPWIEEVITEVRHLTEAPVVLGGVGFSTMPETVLRLSRADAGITGDGEQAVVAITECVLRDEAFSDLPGLVHWRGDNLIINPRADVDLRHMPIPRRRLFDNKRYEQQGAMVGVETKRGCPQQCIFCADPLAKGDKTRLRPPNNVVEELRDLVAQSIAWFHLCDSEFNLPITHAKNLCSAILEAGLGDRIRWYCYCAPTPFDQDLAKLMKLAGCAGINFGVDSLCDEQLHRLGRKHSAGDIERLTHILKQAEINYMFDLLIGGPGETEETVRKTIEQIRRLDTPLAGMAVGVRIYPGTPLSQAIADGCLSGGLYPPPERNPDEPLFYLSPPLGNDVFQMISDLVSGDPRFLLLASPDQDGSYNYAGDEILCQLIENGARGAYWDIIRQNR